jgi:hypothetical protein
MAQLDIAWVDHARGGLDQGVLLSRLLELTRPTPAQAVLIGLDTVSGVRTVHAAGSAHGRVSPGEVRIDGAGQVRLAGYPAGIPLGSTAPSPGRRQADLVALGGLLTELARAARRVPPGTDQRAPALLAALDAAADYAARPGADIELLAGSLAVANGPDPGAVVRSEIAALVAATSASGHASAARLAQSGQAAAASPPEGSPRQSWTALLGAGLRRGWRRTWAWVVALVVLVSVVSLEFVLLQDRLTHDVDLLLGGDQPGQISAQQIEATSEALPPVTAPAPARAGAVDGVDLRALAPCTAAAVCTVRVLVRLQPQPQSQPVTWTFQVIDRCTDSAHSVPGGAVTVPPGGVVAQAVSTVPVPPGRALAVIAVTSQPASAASRPLLVPARQDGC